MVDGANIPSSLTISKIRMIRVAGRPSPLVPLKQIPRVHLVRHVRELVAPAVGHDHVAAGLEGLQAWVTSEPKNSGASSVGS